MSNRAIVCENLGKEYVIGKRHANYRTLRDTLADVVTSPFRRAQRLARGESVALSGETIWALRDVSFEINHGEVIAVIGRNGAGKSTLLKILSRITEPSHGYAEIHGRVGSLLEVGTGFHPELTGRENTFLNGAILGMTKSEMARKFDEIVAFSEIEKFIDTPVKYYSSGMYVRLAFAVAAHLDPEILILDEVLAVGDTAFQKKCLGKIGEVNRSGRTIVMVSHNITATQNLCRKGIVLQNGRLVIKGNIREAVDCYLRSVSGNGKPKSFAVDLTDAQGRPTKCPSLLRRLELLDDSGAPLNGDLAMGGGLRVKVYFELERPTKNFHIGLGFDSLMGQRVFTAHSMFEPKPNWGEHQGAQCMTCHVPSFTLVPGEYRLKVALNMDNREVDFVEDATRVTVLESDYYGAGKVPWNGTCVMPHRWYLG
jgi:lipopolysaccharide transport system ATP-binding protein